MCAHTSYFIKLSVHVKVVFKIIFKSIFVLISQQATLQSI